MSDNQEPTALRLRELIQPDGRVVIPKGVTAIEPFAFKGCHNLTQVVISKKLLEHSADAFAGLRFDKCKLVCYS
jgi:hypothetical protein